MTLKMLLLAGIAFLFSFKSNAQSEYYYEYDWHTEWISNYPVRSKVNPSISKATIKHQAYKKSGKKEKPGTTSFKKFDEKGRLIEYSYLDKKGREKKEIVFAYDQYGFKSYAEWYKKGKLKTKTTYKNRPDGKLLLAEKRNAKGEILQKTVWTFNQDDDLIDCSLYQKGGLKIKSRWVYEYYAKGKKSKSVLYKHDKIKNTWSFDCKEEGQKLKKRRNETQVCKWEQVSIDFITKTEQSFNEKGKVIKKIKKFAAKDTTLLEIAEYNEKDVITHKMVFDPTIHWVTENSVYRKGKLLSQDIYTYSKDTLYLSDTWIWKGKIRSKTEYTYDTKSNIMQMKHFAKKDRLWYTVSLEYEQKNN